MTYLKASHCCKICWYINLLIFLRVSAESIEFTQSLYSCSLFSSNVNEELLASWPEDNFVDSIFLLDYWQWQGIGCIDRLLRENYEIQRNSAKFTLVTVIILNVDPLTRVIFLFFKAYFVTFSVAIICYLLIINRQLFNIHPCCRPLN
jgi:hypothetical protein